MNVEAKITQPSPTLLVVDDDPALRFAMTRPLKQAGYTVLEGTTAAEALTLTRTHRPALVLLDVMLPDGDGREVARQLKTDPDLAGVFVVLLSGLKISPADQAMGLREGLADGYLLRPVSGPVLLGWVEAFLRLRAAQEKAEHYRQLFEAESDAVFLIDNETGRILEANQAATVLYGYSGAELLAKKNTDLSAEAEETQRITRGTPVLTERIVTIPLRFHHKKDDTVFPVEITSRFFTWQGRSVHIATIRDITDRKRMEAALRKSDPGLRAIFENSLTSFLLIDRNLRIQSFNRIASEWASIVFGKEIQPGDSIYEIVLPQDRGSFDQAFQRALTGEWLQVEKTFKVGTGNRWFEFHYAPVNTDGEVTGVFFSIVDITDRKQAEAALRESEERYRRLADNAPDIIFRYDLIPEMRLAYINPVVQAITGYTPTECYADPYLVFNMAHPDDAGMMVDYVQKRTLPDQPLLMRWIGKDGVIRWMESRILPVYDEAGQLVATEGITRDITKRKQAEEARQRSEERLQLVLQGSNDAPWDWNLESNELYYSPRWWAMLGYEVNELPAEADLWKRLLHPADQALADEIFGGALKTGAGAYEVEFRLRHKDGHYVSLFSRGVILRDASGKPVRVSGTNSDITKRKQAEAELRRINERFMQLAQQSRTYTWEVDAAGRYTYVSPVVESIIGYRPEELIGKMHFYELHPESEQEAFKAMGLEIFSRKGVFRDLENVVQTKAGQTAWLSTSGIPILDDQGKLWGYWGTDRDITERKQAEAAQAQLEAQTRQLQKAESLGRMAGAIAHHFNNQLTAVMGYLELTLMKQLPQSQDTKNLSQAMAAAHRAAEVSGLMLTYLGQTPDKQESLDLAGVCAQNLPILRATMPKNVTLETAWPTPGPVIRTDAGRIQQLLTNLVTNGWEAIGDGPGRIHLAVETVSPADIPTAHRFPLDWQPQHQAYVCLAVTDTGVGIADPDIEKIFDPFYSTKFTGRGLGLAVVLGIVRSHSGAVTVESQPGRGSTFRLFFPVTAQESPYRPGQAAQPAEMSRGGTVLLVEDEKMVRYMATEMLAHLGFTVLAAQDGVEAVVLFRQHQPEIRCVLCDLTMPRMDGWETLTALRQLSPGLPVVLASGYDEAQVMAGRHPERPQAFLGKPYQLAALKDALAGAMVK
jgi:PAS domain S-box-containing protein